MASESRTTWRSPCVNLYVDPTEQDELAGTQDLGRRSDIGSNKAFTLFQAPTLPLVLPFSKDLFTKFMKVFMEMMQAQSQALAEP